MKKKLVLISIKKIEFPDKVLSTPEKVVTVTKNKYTFLDSESTPKFGYRDYEAKPKYLERLVDVDEYTPDFAYEYEMIPREFAGNIKWQISL